jgi:hypothetical protein
VVAVLVSGLVAAAGTPPARAAFPGRDGLIAFQSNRDGHDEIYVMKSDGTAQTRITDTAGGNGDPSWSADGSKIVLSSTRDGNAEIYSMDAGGGNQVRLTTSPASTDETPVLSPDGSKIAFVSWAQAPAELWVMDANGANPVNITNDPGYDTSPSWSPDGSKIMFSRDGDLFTIHPDGTGLTPITNTPGYSEYDADWSPDGSRIVFLSTNGVTPGIVVANADGSSPRYLSSSSYTYDSGPRWSPDGTFLVFDSLRTGTNRAIYRTRADGFGDAVRLTDGIPPGSGFPTDSAPSWQPLTDPSSPRGEFTPLSPARIVDTRIGTGGKLGKLGPGQSFLVQIGGAGGVPASGVSAVVMNVTVTEPTAPSYLTVWPTGVSRPSPSNLNFVPGQTVPNLVNVAVGSGNRVSVYNNAGATHVVIDVVGFYADGSGASGSRFNSLQPVRIFDTRYGTSGVGTRPLTAGQTLRFKTSAYAGVPPDATAVVMNVTVTEPTSSGFLTVYPDDVGRPVASNLNFVAGLTVPNLVVVRIPANGIVDFYNFSNGAGTVHVLADVVGYYSTTKLSEAGRLVTGTPTRLMDTRVSSPAPWPYCIGPGAILALQFSNPQIGAVVLNVTVTQPTASGYVTGYALDPANPVPPLASTVNYVPGQTVPNLAMLKLGKAGLVGFYNYAGCTHLVIDAFGAFTSAAAPAPAVESTEAEPEPYGDVTASIQ